SVAASPPSASGPPGTRSSYATTSSPNVGVRRQGREMTGMSLFGFRPRPDERPDDEPWPEAMWPLPDGVELRGEVVTLRPVQPADHAELRQALDHPACWEHMSTQ